jgi:hypothetical protein
MNVDTHHIGVGWFRQIHPGGGGLVKSVLVRPPKVLALTLVMFAPSPLKPLAVTVPEKATLPLNRAMLVESWLSAIAPLNAVALLA